jgi:hypothetical protein
MFYSLLNAGIILFCMIGLAANAQEEVTVAPNGKVMPGARFYFKGEAHEYVQENAASLLAVVKYLYQHNNVRYLVMESGPDQAYLANYYLVTGIDSFPEKYKLYLRSIFWKDLYEFNKTLPEGQQLRVMGFDFNRYVYTAGALKLMQQDHSPFHNKVLQEAYARVVAWDTVAWNMNRQERFEKDLDQLKHLVQGNENEIKEILGSAYADFYKILHNATPAISQVKRDKIMVSQLLVDLPLMDRGNILLNYGVAHTFLDGVGAAHILASKKEFREKVCSIYPYYLKGDKPKSLLSMENKLPEEFLQKVNAYPNYTLVDLQGSKFKRSQYVLVIK